MRSNDTPSKPARRPSHRDALAATLALAALVGPAAARASDRWSQPLEGVSHLHRRVGPFDYHLVRLPLNDPRLRVVGTSEEDVAPREGAKRAGHRWTTVSSFARRTGADIAINANYFDLFARRFSTCGLTRTAGHTWTSAYLDRRLDCDDSIGFGDGNRAEVFDSSGALDALPARLAWATTVVTGSPRLLREGEVVEATYPRHALSRNPRTAIGLSRDRHTLFLLVVNGREGRAQGMTCVEAARTLRAHGAWDAVNLDGGGSSALYIRREHGIVSRFADGSERGVGNHLGFVFAPSAPHEPAPNVDAAPADALVARAAPEAAPTALVAAANAERPARAVLFPALARPLARQPRAPQGAGSWLAFGLSSAIVGLAALVRRRRA